MTSARWCLGLEYDGSNYHGWQKQANVQTIQGNVEKVLSQVACHPVFCYAAGRTDKGVHAQELTVHFDSTTQRHPYVWLRALNSLLPADIRCKWLQRAPENFHARHSAIARKYQYQICTQKHYQPVFSRRNSWWFPYDIDLQALITGAKVFTGEHDFSGYRGRDCQATSTVKTIQPINIVNQNNFIELEITGNAFLHHMVRNMVGALMLVAQNKRDVSWLKNTLQAKQRVPEIPMAPARGLTFIKATYPIDLDSSNL